MLERVWLTADTWEAFGDDLGERQLEARLQNSSLYRLRLDVQIPPGKQASFISSYPFEIKIYPGFCPSKVWTS